jgi:hypothetical protein
MVFRLKNWFKPLKSSTAWWFQTRFFPHHILGMSSSQLTNSFFEGWLKHQPVKNIQKPPWFIGHVSENAGFSEI